jgi:2-amino-4-hydroxy-6-hydroxymethyldihydropteridine diphosphokinase
MLLGEKVHFLVRASLYQSRAVGYTDQPDFLNTVVKGETQLTPEELLIFVKQIEQQLGRVERFRWGPREIDVDIIFYGDKLINQPDLTIPHPRFRNRDFVLQPLCELGAAIVDPATGLTCRQLLERLPSKQRSLIKKIT